MDVPQPADSSGRGKVRMFVDGFLIRNLEVLSRRQPDLATLLRQVTVDRIQPGKARSGLQTAVYRRADGAAIPLHDDRDPLAEARANIRKHNLQEADYIVLLGFGLGYPLDAILEIREGSEIRFFVVEADLQILRVAMEFRDLSHILSLPHIHFCWPPEGPALADQWRAFFDPVQAQRNLYIGHPPSLVLDPGLFKSAAQTIQSQTAQIFTDINTLVGRMDLFLANFVGNWGALSASPGVEGFRGKAAGLPCVIVSAGPSLDRNIHELRGAEEQALIIAVDTAVKPLRAAGVQPRFVVCADPTHENYLHLQGADIGSAWIVVEATANRGIFSEFRGRTIVCTFADSSLRSFAGLLRDKGHLRAWGSVATMALDFALLLGCNPVILTGQDLAYSDGRPYCTGVYFEESWFSGLEWLDFWRDRLAVALQGRNLITLEDLFGNPVQTTDRLVSYWNWFRKEISLHPDVAFINATEGGILREGVQIMSLREALYRFGRKMPELQGILDESFHSACRGESQSVQAELSFIRRDCEGVAGALDRGLALARSTSGPQPEKLLRRLEETRESIYSYGRVAPLLDCFNQMGNVGYLRGKRAVRVRPPAAPDPDKVRKLYADYFGTVRAALEKILPALDRLQKPAT